MNDKISKYCTCGYEWKTGKNGSHSCVSTMQKTIEKALEVAVQYGGFDGGHHKGWVIDQMVRILAGEGYDQLVKDACDGAYGADTYSWDCGIAP